MAERLDHTKPSNHDQAVRGSARDVLDFIDGVAFFCGLPYVWVAAKRSWQLDPPVPVRWSDA